MAGSVLGRTRSHRQFLAAVLILSIIGSGVVLVAAPVGAHSSANETNTTSTNASDAASGGRLTDSKTVSCEQIKDHPSISGDRYRVVTGSCSIQLSEGTILENVLFRAQGQAVNIQARGRGWTIRNVGIVNAAQGEDTVIDMQVNDRNGTGYVENLYVNGTSANAIFVNANHAGHIEIVDSTFLNVQEDVLYASAPGNLHSVNWGKDPGRGGTVTVRDSYARNVGRSAGGDEQGYAFRFGSDGSAIVNTTIVNADVAVANLFGVGSMPASKPGVAPGLTVRNVDIVNSGTGFRLGSHQADLQSKIDRSTITRFSGVEIDAGDPVQRNLGARLQGSYTGTVSTAPPAGAPRSALRAASGVGGGTGSIGGPISGGGPFPGADIVTELVGGAVALVIDGVIGIAIGALIPALLLLLLVWWILS